MNEDMNSDQIIHGRREFQLKAKQNEQKREADQPRANANLVFSLS